jgi:hypothetical protein
LPIAGGYGQQLPHHFFNRQSARRGGAMKTWSVGNWKLEIGKWKLGTPSLGQFPFSSFRFLVSIF